jgi:hypothetical protein
MKWESWYIHADLSCNDCDGECGCEWHQDVRIKPVFNGAATLAEAASRARLFADQLQEMHDKGWLLKEPFDDDGWGYARKPAAVTAR